MLEPVEVEVNGRKYTVNPFNPIDAYNFHHDWINAVAYGRSVAALGMKCIGQCCDSMQRNLGIQENFQKIFSEYPEDMFELEVKAKEALTGPFETKKKDTKKNEKTSLKE